MSSNKNFAFKPFIELALNTIQLLQIGVECTISVASIYVFGSFTLNNMLSVIGIL